MVSEQVIIEFINVRIGERPLAETDINGELRIEGEDFNELIEAFAEQFKVDITSYLWYFHHEEEGFQISLGRIFFKPPNLRVERIPVTPTMLADFANKGKWEISYPKHNIPEKRMDIVIDWIFAGICFIFMLWLFLK